VVRPSSFRYATDGDWRCAAAVMRDLPSQAGRNVWMIMIRDPFFLSWI
jgi:hypothetical protein